MMTKSTAEIHQQHVWVRLSGYGLTVLPATSFSAARSDGEPSSLDVELADGKFGRIIPDAGGYRSKIDRATTQSLHEVVSIGQSDRAGRWRIETILFGVDWPPGLVLRSDGIEPFELWNDEELLFYAQSVKQRPDLADLCGPGQTVVEQLPGATVPSILLSYVHDYLPWMQRHSVFSDGKRHVVVSAQFPEKVRQAGEGLGGQLCASFRWNS